MAKLLQRQKTYDKRFTPDPSEPRPIRMHVTMTAVPKTLNSTHRSTTIKRPAFTYLHLTLLSSEPVSSSRRPPVDLITARTYLTSALHQFLGMTGAAIPVDFLKANGSDVWIRVPREDGAAVLAAVSQWVGREGAVSWRVRGKGEWLGCVSAGDGRQLFDP